ncbi:hypothetical protein ALC60_02911, partial [Trachymyrmex zeteki]
IEISYSPVPPDDNVPLDLSIPSIPDPLLLDILQYSPPPISERFPPPDLFEQPISPPSSDQLPILPPASSPIGPSSEEWDRTFRFYSATYNADQIVTVYIPGNPTPYTVLYQHLQPLCSSTTHQHLIIPSLS